MLKTLIVLADGTVLSSGGEGAAIVSAALTQTVNQGQELSLGSACSAMVECRLLEAAGVDIAPGDALTVYQQEGDTRHLLGTFYAQTPVRKGASTLELTAYDSVSLLDRDLTDWLGALEQWPYTLYEFAGMVCSACGLTLVNETLPNGDYPLQPFRADNVTGRQLLSWVGQIAGRFCRATPEGDIEFAWYTPLTTHDIGVSPVENRVFYEDGTLTLTGHITAQGDGDVVLTSGLLCVTDDGMGNVTLTMAPGTDTVMCFAGGLVLEDYTVAPIEKVQLQQNQEDVGTVYPDTPDSLNTYSITGNPLLSALSGDSLVPIARVLYEQLKAVTYTPCKLSVPANVHILPGHTVTVTDRTGRTVTAYIMAKNRKGQQDDLECTGSASRQSSTAVNNQSFSSLAGKVLNLRTDVDGIKAENRDTSGKLSALEMDLEGVRTQVQRLDTLEQGQRALSTSITQTADEVKLLVEQVNTGEAGQVKTSNGYTFSDAGLHIQRSGESVENLLTHEGMYVKRSGSVILQADKDGVLAVDVSVGNFLVMGDHARFEDFPDSRTACFYI